ncbi:MAG: amino acid permease [Balneolaceae bacterium]|nr:amino acid permease [Balneolaceae bacterium]
MESPASQSRTIGLTGATGIGVGAMVGGGILALAGVAFSVSGPSAILAFALNGVIALIIALSFAEMAAAHPQSGGTYTFAKKALSLNVAFGVGWVVWFASIVAAVLYALGFGAFAAFSLQQVLPSLSESISSAWFTTLLALCALGYYVFQLTRSSGGGGSFINIGKVAVFAVLIAGGLAAFVTTPVSHVRESLDPFFAGGFSGLIAAMGYTFIALQGFDLIAAASGEIKSPEKTIPKAMMATLAIGLTIYIPLLFVISTVGMNPGESITEVSSAYPETVVAIAAQNYLGSFGFWLVMVAGIFSMLSALQANVFAASRIALAMSLDRTLSHQLSVLHEKFGTPVIAIYITGGIVALLIFLLPDVAAAGAASSLIFLITFALAQGVNMLMRKRSFKQTITFRVPLYPALPIIGISACVGLAMFQAVAVPSAGIIALIWLILGSFLFVIFFVQRARVIDASNEALNPDLVRLRGLSPLVLVPIANPANADSMVFVANALAPPQVGRVLLLSIVTPDEDRDTTELKLENSQNAMRKALSASFDSGLRPDALATIADERWGEIARVVKVHRCRSLLLGLSYLTDTQTAENLEKLVAEVHCDVVVFRTPYSGWNIKDAKRILVPVGGTGEHDALRARVLGSLWRTTQPEITFVQMVPENTPAKKLARIEIDLKRFAGRIIPGNSSTMVIPEANVPEKLTELTHDFDLVVMGLGKAGPNSRAFGSVTQKLAGETGTALILISHSK